MLLKGSKTRHMGIIVEQQNIWHFCGIGVISEDKSRIKICALIVYQHFHFNPVRGILTKTGV